MADRRSKLLRDVLAAGAAIESFVHGRSFDDYERDLMLRSATERQFEIIGEAVRRLLVSDSAFATRIDHVHTIIAFRNIIAHGYDALDSKIVWGVIEDDLGALMASVRSLLNELDRSSE